MRVEQVFQLYCVWFRCCTWKCVLFLNEAKRVHMFESVCDSLMYSHLSSGGRAGGPCPSQDSWHYSRHLGTWSQLPFCSVGRAYSAMAPLPDYDGEMVVHYGGIDAMNRQILSVSCPTLYVCVVLMYCTMYVRLYVHCTCVCTLCTCMYIVYVYVHCVRIRTLCMYTYIVHAYVRTYMCTYTYVCLCVVKNE